MVTKIQKWGNSQGLRLPKSVLADTGLQVGDEVDVVVRDGTILIEPVRKIRGRYRLEDLVANLPREQGTGEVRWGEPVGREAW